MRFSRNLLAALLLATAGAAQQPPTYIETFEVRVIDVDVVVADKSGNRVHGLTDKDFELFDNGLPQEITNFSEYAVERRVSPRIETAVQTGAASLTTPPPRRIVAVFDDLVLHGITIGQLSRKLGGLIDSLDDGDQMMIVVPARRRKVVQPFTGEKLVLKRRVDEVLHASSFRATSAFKREQMAFNADGLDAANDRYSRPNGVRMYSGVVAARVKQVLGYVHAICGALAEVKGRKAVIIISQSLPIEPGREAWPLLDLDAAKTSSAINLSDRSQAAVSTSSETVTLSSPFDNPIWQNLRPLIDDIARTASTNGVTVYSLQPEIPMSETFGDLAESAGRNRRTGARDTDQPSNMRMNILSEQLAMTQSTFTAFADATGGAWFRGGRGVDQAFDAIETDLGNYYSLGYHAPQSEQDQARHIEVRVRGRNDVLVRARRDVVRKSPAEEMRDRTLANLIVPSHVDELGIAVSQRKPQWNGRIVSIPIEIRVPLKSLTFLPDGDKYRASFRIHIASTGERGDFASGEAKEQVIEVPRERYEAARTKFWSYIATIETKPGPMQIAIGILDPLSKLSSYRTLSIDAR